MVNIYNWYTLYFPEGRTTTVKASIPGHKLKQTRKSGVETYRQLELLNILYSSALSTFQWPSFILCNLSCHVLCIYIALKLLDTLHPVIGIMYDSWGVMWFGVDLVIFPHTENLKEISEDYLHYLSSGRTNKLDMAVMRSLRPAGVKVGNFILMNKTTALTIIVIVSNLTINAILLI